MLHFGGLVHVVDLDVEFLLIFLARLHAVSTMLFTDSVVELIEHSIEAKQNTRGEGPRHQMKDAQLEANELRSLLDSGSLPDRKRMKLN